MAKEVQTKKRKASVPEDNADKTKKVKKVTSEATSAPVKKRKATEEAAPVAVKKSKTPKPAVEDVPKSKSAKKNVTSEKPTDNTNGIASKSDKSAVKELKSAKAAKTKEVKQPNHIDPPSEAEEDHEEEVEGEDDDSEIDDQTEALLKGFESDGDEEDAEKEGGLEKGQEVPQAPKMSKKQKKQIEKAAGDKPRIVYIGRIPHGFYEHEMKEYFKQFGTILKLRLSRNRKTGASKHVAWIQFESSVVAEIVAKTMDNYLLFNHVLKVKVVPDEQVSPYLWEGANKRFKQVPWNKIENRKLAQPKMEGDWEKVNAREQGRRAKKAEKLKEIGYEFEAPELKSPQGLGRKVGEVPVVVEAETEVKAIEPAPRTEEQGLKAKEKKEKKREKKEAIEAANSAPDDTVNAAVEERKAAKKQTKERKRKAMQVEADSAEPATEVSEDKVKKPKKSKKVKSTD